MWPKHDSDAGESDVSAYNSDMNSDSDSDDFNGWPLIPPPMLFYDINVKLADFMADPENASTICFDDTDESESDIFEDSSENSPPSTTNEYDLATEDGSSHGTVDDFLSEATCLICNDRPPFAVANSLKMAYVESGVSYAVHDGVPHVRCSACHSWYHLLCLQMSGQSDIMDQ